MEHRACVAPSLSITRCRAQLACHVADEAKADVIYGALNDKYPSHSFPILLDGLVRIGLQAERRRAAGSRASVLKPRPVAPKPHIAGVPSRRGRCPDTGR